jgi:hypothetical protein
MAQQRPVGQRGITQSGVSPGRSVVRRGGESKPEGAEIKRAAIDPIVESENPDVITAV